MYLLGYIPKDNRIYLSDKDINIYSYSLPQSVIEFETAILREDFEAAKMILPNIPSDQLNKTARFLESQSTFFFFFFFFFIFFNAIKTDIKKIINIF